MIRAAVSQVKIIGSKGFFRFSAPSKSTISAVIKMVIIAYITFSVYYLMVVSSNCNTNDG